MIIVDAGLNDIKSFDAKILFATQLAQQGHTVAIDDNSTPQDIDRIQKYEVSPFLTDISSAPVGGLVLIGAEDISETTLMNLQSYDLAADVAVSALGRFADHQRFVSASPKIAFALGHEANVVDLNEVQKSRFYGRRSRLYRHLVIRRKEAGIISGNYFCFCRPICWKMRRYCKTCRRLTVWPIFI